MPTVEPKTVVKEQQPQKNSLILFPVLMLRSCRACYFFFFKISYFFDQHSRRRGLGITECHILSFV